MSQQPPPWGPQQYPQQGPAGETPSGVPAPPPQNQGWQQYPAQQPYGQPSAQQPYGQPSAPQPPAPAAAGGAPASVGSPAAWVRRYPRLVLLCGAVLSLMMMIPAWVSVTYSISSTQITTNAHGLGWISTTPSSESPISPGAWNFRVVATLLVILAIVVLGSIGLVLDRLLPSWWDLATLIVSGVLGILMIWGVVQAAQFAGNRDETSGTVQASTAAGVWLFLVTVLITLGGAVWQFILDRRAAAPARPGPQWTGAPGHPQGPGPQQPGYQQGPPPQQWNQPGTPQQGWNNPNQWGQ